MARTLPIEVVSLIHHLELHQDRWWETSVEQLVLAAVWLSAQAPTVSELRAYLRKQFAVELTREKASAALNALLESGDLISIRGSRYKVPEETRAKLHSERAAAEATAKRVQDRFAQQLTGCCPRLDVQRSWLDFQNQMLLPLIKELGAGAYQLITGAVPSLPETHIRKFLERYPSEVREGLRDAIVAFLDPSDEDVRSFVLGLLRSYFFVEATSLSKSTLAAIANAMAKPPSFAVFCDSNLIFSLIRLHDNPANDAALFLKQLIGNMSGVCEVKLVALDITIDEVRDAIAHHSKVLDSVNWSHSFAEAALADPRLSYRGLGEIYLRSIAETGERVSAREFFSDYITDLGTIVSAERIEIFEESAKPYRNRRDVEIDIGRQLAQERGRRTTERAGKTERELRHDVPLWYFVHDKRVAGVENPMNVGAWLVTEDFWLIHFGRGKARYLQERVPVSIHPATLTQLLEFWVPRSPELEGAMLSSLRLPMLFGEFDRKTEQITTRILQRLSRLEHAENLAPETIAEVVRNQVLRSKIAEIEVTSSGSSEREYELIRDALVDRLSQREHELQQASHRSAELEARAQGSDADARSSELRLAAREHELEREQALRKELARELSVLRSSVQEETQVREARTQAARIRFGWVTAPAGLSVVAAVPVGLLYAAAVGDSFVFAVLKAAALLLGLWLYIAGKFAPKHAMEGAVLRAIHAILRISGNSYSWNG